MRNEMNSVQLRSTECLDLIAEFRQCQSMVRISCFAWKWAWPPQTKEVFAVGVYVHLARSKIYRPIDFEKSSPLVRDLTSMLISHSKKKTELCGGDV